MGEQRLHWRQTYIPLPRVQQTDWHNDVRLRSRAVSKILARRGCSGRRCGFGRGAVSLGWRRGRRRWGQESGCQVSKNGADLRLELARCRDLGRCVALARLVARLTTDIASAPERSAIAVYVHRDDVRFTGWWRWWRDSDEGYWPGGWSMVGRRQT